MSLINFSIKKPVTIIVALIIILLVGTLSLSGLTTSLFPSMNLPYAVVSTMYYGASPEEVEMAVTKPTENAMATVENIKSIQSISQENSSLIILEFNDNTDMAAAIVEMRENLDMIQPFMPEKVQSPMIMKLNPDMMPVMAITCSLDGAETVESSEFVDKVVIPRIESVEGVATVTSTGIIENEVQIVIDTEKMDTVNQSIMQDMMNSMSSLPMANGLNEMGMPTSDSSANTSSEVPSESAGIINKDLITGILSAQNLSMPVGYISDDNIDYLVRTGDKYRGIEEVEDLVIFTNNDRIVYLKDVANISLIDTSGEVYSKVNGENSIMIAIQKQNDFAISKVVENVNKEIDSLTNAYEELNVVTIMDQNEYIDMALGSTTQNLIFGALLALLVLYLFLRDLKPTLIIGVAIPVSVFIALIIMYFSGVTINILSMAGLALSIGMLVDNSIVVIENIYRLKHLGKSAKDAAIMGAQQVSGAIIASTLTTIAVFIPMLFVEGLTAQLFRDLALTIAAALIASLLIALSFVPMSSAKLMKGDIGQKEHKGMERVKEFYSKILNRSLDHKIITIVIIVLLLVVSSAGAFINGTEFFPSTDTGQITVTVEMPEGTIFEDSTVMMDTAAEIISKVEGIETVSSSIDTGNAFAGMMGGSGAGSGTIYVLLDEDTKRSTDEISQEIREMTEGYEFKTTLSSDDSMTMMMASGVSIVVKGPELDKLEEIGNDLSEIISSVEGTTNVNNGVSKTSPEVNITVNRKEAISNSLTTAQIFMAVNEFISKEAAVSQLMVGAEDIDIYVIDPDNQNEINIDTVSNLEIMNSQGEMVKISEVAEVTIENGFGTISRVDQQRTINVTADIEDGYNVGIVGQDVNDMILDYSVPDGYIIDMSGESEEINDAMIDLAIALLFGVLLTYLIMVAQFQSFFYPFIVLFTVPLALTGGFLILIITSLPFSIVAAVGLILLAGIVVNNGIVLVDYINQLKESGLSTREAVVEAGNTRLRPIIMTALTTILALTTSAIGLGQGSEMLQPMAITAIGGLIYATALTPIFVPVIYSIFDNIKDKASRRLKRS